jgi:hypothetical protein
MPTPINTTFPVAGDPKSKPKVTTAPVPANPVPARPKDQLLAGQSLVRKDFLLSNNGRFRLTFQEDGNLVMTETDYEYMGPIWKSNTEGSGAVR